MCFICLSNVYNQGNKRVYYVNGNINGQAHCEQCSITISNHTYDTSIVVDR